MNLIFYSVVLVMISDGALHDHIFILIDKGSSGKRKIQICHSRTNSSNYKKSTLKYVGRLFIVRGCHLKCAYLLM